MRSRFLRLGGGLAVAAVCGVVFTALAATGSSATRGTSGARATLSGNTAPGQPTGLSVGDRTHPLNVEGTPQFGWMPHDADGNELQTAYELQVTRDSDGLIIWDSNKVSSSDQSYVAYTGPALADGTSYTWMVKTWDRGNAASPWSDPAHFDTGITDAEWGATWIRRLTSGNDSTVDYTFARKQFTLGDAGSPVVRARAYTSAMGQYELHVNGQNLYRGDSFDYPSEGQYAVTDITSQALAAQQAPDAAANQLAVGMLAYYHTCTCQGRANGPPTNSSTLSAATLAGATNIKVASVTGLIVGDTINVDTGANLENRTITSVGTTGAGGTGVNVDPALTLAHASAVATVSSNGPSGILARIVVDHADGTREVFVTDGSWKVTKDTAYTNATNTSRSGDAGDFVERYDARLEIPSWDTVGFNDSAWSPSTVIGPHPRPVSVTQDRFSHLDGNVSGIAHTTLHPVSVTTLADGTTVADFGKVISAVPDVHFHSGLAGRALTMQTAYLPVNTTMSAASAVGATNIKVGSVTNFVAGDRIIVDGPGPGFPVGNPETRTIVTVGTTGSGGTGITLDAPLSSAHTSGRYVAGTRASTASIDNQGSTMTWFYTQKDGDQVAQAFTYWGWRFLQIPPAGETLTADDITAVLQHTDAPADRTATFSSGISLLDNGFTMMQRSGLYASQETGVDTPTREKGQFTGDGVDYGVANMAASGERNASKRMMREFAYSGSHSWKATSSGYCVTAPCSYPGYGPLSAGRLNAVYPNGDNMRDIPDYTELYPDFIWNYYVMSGDRQTLAANYGVLQADVAYVHNNQPASGSAAGLTWVLAGGTGSYQNGIIDWPSRLGYVFTNNGARTIHAAEAVGVYRTTAKAATALGDTANAAIYNGYADDLTAAINAKQRISGDTLYSDGLLTNVTTTSAATVVGATNIKVASVTPFTVGDTLAVDFAAGALKETATVTSVGTSGSGGTGIGITPALTKAHASGVTIGTSSATKLYPASTTLSADAAAGASNIKVGSVSGFTSTEGSEANAGPTLIVGTGANREVRRITAVGTTGAGGTGITLAAPLTNAHTASEFVGTPSQQAQTFAILEGVAPKADWASMADYMAAQGLRSAPMNWGQTMDALGLANRPDAIVSMMTRTDQFGPGQVLASGGTWIWEDWTITGSNSMSHGWGARGINSMLKYLLGIDVTSPGAATISIAPPDKGLDHASGSQWTQRGTVNVNWTRTTGNRVTLDVTVPDNVVATVSLPTAASATARVYGYTGDGAPVFQNVADGRENYKVGSGTTHFTVDTTAPVTTAVLAPPAPNGSNGWYTTPVQVTLTALDEDGGSDAVLTEYALDGGAYQPYTVPFTVSAEGSHTLLYRSTDTAGNVEIAQSLAFKIDTVKPATAASLSPASPGGANGWYLVPVQVTLSATDATSGVATTQYSVDGGASTTYAGPFTISADGDHTVQFSSTDTAGNVEASQSIHVKVDQNDPVTTLAIAPGLQNGWYASPTVTLAATDGTGSGVAQVQYSLDGGAWTTYAGPLSGFTTGNHFIQYRATDNAGRQEAVKLFAFKVDAVKPTVNVTRPADGSSYPLDKVVAAAYKCTDNQSGMDTCTGTVANGANLDTSTIGSHAFTVTGTDKAGNVTTVTTHYTVTYTWNGFFAPVGNSSDSSLNLVHAGDLVKVGFGLNGDRGLSIGTFTTVPVACPAWTPHSVPAAGAGTTAGLSYGAASGHYTYGFQTSGAWAGSCRELQLQLNDGTPLHGATFMFFG